MTPVVGDVSCGNWASVATSLVEPRCLPAGRWTAYCQLLNRHTGKGRLERNVQVSAHTCRPIAWLLRQCVLRLRLPSTGIAPLVQHGFVVKLLPKLAFFTLWDRPPSSGLVRSPTTEDPEGGLPGGGPPPSEAMDSPEPEPIAAAARGALSQSLALRRC